MHSAYVDLLLWVYQNTYAHCFSICIVNGQSMSVVHLLALRSTVPLLLVVFYRDVGEVCVKRLWALKQDNPVLGQ